uniref:Uncharacterized protein n=1 Tax=Acrobeloides nanus TaxID=290746 RepID=A0A914DSX6_9BILA
MLGMLKVPVLRVIFVLKQPLVMAVFKLQLIAMDPSFCPTTTTTAIITSTTPEMTTSSSCGTMCSFIIDGGNPFPSTADTYPGQLCTTYSNNQTCNTAVVTCTGGSVTTTMFVQLLENGVITQTEFAAGQGPVEMTIECGGDGTWLVDNFKIANTIYCEASCGVGVVCPSPEPCLATSTTETSTPTTTTPSTCSTICTAMNNASNPASAPYTAIGIETITPSTSGGCTTTTVTCSGYVNGGQQDIYAYMVTGGSTYLIYGGYPTANGALSAEFQCGLDGNWYLYSVNGDTTQADPATPLKPGIDCFALCPGGPCFTTTTELTTTPSTTLEPTTSTSTTPEPTTSTSTTPEPTTTISTTLEHTTSTSTTPEPTTSTSTTPEPTTTTPSPSTTPSTCSTICTAMNNASNPALAPYTAIGIETITPSTSGGCTTTTVTCSGYVNGGQQDIYAYMVTSGSTYLIYGGYPTANGALSAKFKCGLDGNWYLYSVNGDTTQADPTTPLKPGIDCFALCPGGPCFTTTTELTTTPSTTLEPTTSTSTTPEPTTTSTTPEPTTTTSTTAEPTTTTSTTEEPKTTSTTTPTATTSACSTTSCIAMSNANNPATAPYTTMGIETITPSTSGGCLTTATCSGYASGGYQDIYAYMATNGLAYPIYGGYPTANGALSAEFQCGVDGNWYLYSVNGDITEGDPATPLKPGIDCFANCLGGPCFTTTTELTTTPSTTLEPTTSTSTTPEPTTSTSTTPEPTTSTSTTPEPTTTTSSSTTAEPTTTTSTTEESKTTSTTTPTATTSACSTTSCIAMSNANNPATAPYTTIGIETITPSTSSGCLTTATCSGYASGGYQDIYAYMATNELAYPVYGGYPTANGSLSVEFQCGLDGNWYLYSVNGDTTEGDPATPLKPDIDCFANCLGGPCFTTTTELTATPSTTLEPTTSTSTTPEPTTTSTTPEPTTTTSSSTTAEPTTTTSTTEELKTTSSAATTAPTTTTPSTCSTSCAAMSNASNPASAPYTAIGIETITPSTSRGCTTTTATCSGYASGGYQDIYAYMTTNGLAYPIYGGYPTANGSLSVEFQCGLDGNWYLYSVNGDITEGDPATPLKPGIDCFANCLGGPCFTTTTELTATPSTTLEPTTSTSTTLESTTTTSTTSEPITTTSTTQELTTTTSTTPEPTSTSITPEPTTTISTTIEHTTSTTTTEKPTTSTSTTEEPTTTSTTPEPTTTTSTTLEQTITTTPETTTTTSTEPATSTSTTVEMTTITSTTPEPTTTTNTTPEPTTSSSSTSEPTTTSTTEGPKTTSSTTSEPTTSTSTTPETTTTTSTTAEPSTTTSSTREPTTTTNTTLEPTTTASTTAEPSTTTSTTPEPSTTTSTTPKPTTPEPTTSSTMKPTTTIEPTTIISTTQEPTTTHKPTTTAAVPVTTTLKELTTTIFIPSTTTASTCCCPQNGIWSSWSAANECSDSCGSCAQITYTRTCLSGSTCPCTGATTKSENCNILPCTYPRAACCNNLTAIVDATLVEIICGPQPTPAPEAAPPTCASCTGAAMTPVWLDWSEWSACSGTCGQCGTSTRNRTCALSECCSCVGNDTETQECAVTGTWSNWTLTSQCNGTCGACGVMVYSRNCTSTSCSCYGESTKTEVCGLESCSFPSEACCNGLTVGVYNGEFQCGPITYPTDEPFLTCPSCCPTNGIWSEWGDIIVSCNDTCGMCGVQTRIRTCLSGIYGCACTGSSTRQENCGVMPCAFPRAACCTGFQRAIVDDMFECVAITTDPTTTLTPTQTPCCPPDGNGLWNPWQAWSDCSASCGGCGTQTRSRTCASEPYGCPCTGSSSGQQICCSATCATTVITCPPGGTWSAWSTGTCNDTCGMCGSLTQTRTCLSEADGCPCTGATSEITGTCGAPVCIFPRPDCCSPYTRTLINNTIVCATTAPVTTATTVACPAGGTWSAWSATSCNDTCGMCGSLLSNRTCTSASLGCACTGADTLNQGSCGSALCIFPRPACCPGATRQIVNSTFQCVLNTTQADAAAVTTTTTTTISPAPTTTACPVGGTWSAWGTASCNDTCGLCGSSIQSRTCLSGSTGCPCT